MDEGRPRTQSPSASTVLTALAHSTAAVLDQVCGNILCFNLLGSWQPLPNASVLKYKKVYNVPSACPIKQLSVRSAHTLCLGLSYRRVSPCGGL